MIIVNSEELSVSIEIKDTLYMDEIVKTLLRSGYWVMVDYTEDEGQAVITIKDRQAPQTN